MARIFITGSSDGLGQMAAQKLVNEGHSVVLHARNGQRARHAIELVPGADKVLIADLSKQDETKRLAEEVNSLGKFDAIIHNAGVYQDAREKILGINVLAPYILTSLIEIPERLVYISSGLHMQGNPDITNLTSGNITYSDSKAYVSMLAFAVARKMKNVYSNSVDPGWVPTKMGGKNAPDDLQKGFGTQAWLAVSNDPAAMVSGHHFFHQKAKQHLSLVDDPELQERFLLQCEKMTGIRFSA